MERGIRVGGDSITPYHPWIYGWFKSRSGYSLVDAVCVWTSFTMADFREPGLWLSRYEGGAGSWGAWIFPTSRLRWTNLAVGDVSLIRGTVVTALVKGSLMLVSAQEGPKRWR